MTHEFSSCSCALCLSFRRIYNLLYREEASGAQLLDFSEGGEGAATPVPPEAAQEKQVVVKEEPKPEEESKESKRASGDRRTEGEPDRPQKDPGESGSAAEEFAPSKKEKKKRSRDRDRDRRRRRDKERDDGGGAEDRSRSQGRDRKEKRASPARSPRGERHTSPSLSRKSRERKSARKSPRTPSPSPRPSSPRGAAPSRASGLTNAQKRAIPPPPKPPPRVPREPDHPPPGYSSWEDTDVRSKSWAYHEPPPNKGRKKDERNTNFRLWREHERGYYCRGMPPRRRPAAAPERAREGALRRPRMDVLRRPAGREAPEPPELEEPDWVALSKITFNALNTKQLVVLEGRYWESPVLVAGEMRGVDRQRRGCDLADLGDWNAERVAVERGWRTMPRVESPCMPRSMRPAGVGQRFDPRPPLPRARRASRRLVDQSRRSSSRSRCCRRRRSSCSDTGGDGREDSRVRLVG